MIKKFTLSVLSLLLLLSGLLVFFPNMILNQSSVSGALRLFNVDSVVLQKINQGKWSISKSALFAYGFTYSHPKLCINLKEFEGCLQNVELELEFHSFTGERVSQLKLHTLKATIEGANLNFVSTENNTKSENTASTFDPIDVFHSILKFSKQVEVGEVDLSLSALKVLYTSEEELFVESFSVLKKNELEQVEFSLKAGASPFRRFDVELSVPWVGNHVEILDKFRFGVDILWSSHSFRMDYKASEAESPSSTRFAFLYENKTNGLRSSGILGVEWAQELQLFFEDASVERKQVDFFSKKILIDECRFTLAKGDLSKEVVESLRGSLVKGRCFLNSEIKKSKDMLWGNDLLIESIAVQFLSEVHFSKDYDIKGKITVKTRPFTKKLGEGDISVNIDFSKSSDGELKMEDAKLVGQLKLHSFKNIAATLNQYFLAVPAPFHVLDGVIDSSLKGRFEWKTMRLESVFTAKSNLKSEHQQLSAFLKSSVSGDFLHKPVIALDSDLVLLDAQVQLPEVNLRRVALPIKDSRLVLKKSQKAQKGDFLFESQFSIKTKKPLLVVNPKPKFVMPVVLDLKSDPDQKIKGHIRLEPFEGELFKREIKVESLVVLLPSEKITGLLTTRALEYDVSMMISGKPDSIKLNFQSSPPLERRQIIALLLFNDPAVAEESEKAAAAGHFDVAAAQGALSLASFYMLGNTRLQSFNYDPITQAVSARLRLDNGSSVELIAGEEGVEGVGYVRRVGRSWRIKTLGQDSRGGRESQSGQALIEWFKYFD